MSKTSTALVAILGLAALANGLFMIFAPEPWYWLVPGVPERGPYNQHFLRDIGLIYLLISAALLYGVLCQNALFRKHQFYLWLVPIAWLVCHAIFHVWEVVVGITEPKSMIEDFAGVTLPALIGLVLIYRSGRFQKEK